MHHKSRCRANRIDRYYLSVLARCAELTFCRRFGSFEDVAIVECGKPGALYLGWKLMNLSNIVVLRTRSTSGLFCCSGRSRCSKCKHFTLLKIVGSRKGISFTSTLEFSMPHPSRRDNRICTGKNSRASLTRQKAMTATSVPAFSPIKEISTRTRTTARYC